ncbi:MAG: type II secretion system F family protein [Nitrospinota bacterium]
MTSFEYHGVDHAGRTISGVVSASSNVDAKRRLAERGIFPDSLWPQSRRGFRLLRGRKLSLHHLATFVRSLASLSQARLPMLEVLRVIASEAERGLVRQVCEQLKGRVEAGMSLADALREFPEHFPSMMVSLVAAGERSGRLDETLQAFASYIEDQDRFRARLRAMMAYPLLVLCLAIVLVLVLLLFVLPALQGIFEGYRGTLPFPSRVLLGVKQVVTEYPWILVLAGALGGLGVWLVVGAPAVRDRWAKFILSVPLLGKTVKALETSRFAFTLMNLLRGGVPLDEALSLTQGTLKNSLFADTVRRARAGILEGESLVAHLGGGALFPATAIQLIRVGEETGQLPNMLDHLARLFGEEGERRFETLVRLVEPGLILAVGLFVAFVALAVLLPIFEAGQLIRG